MAYKWSRSTSPADRHPTHLLRALDQHHKTAARPATTQKYLLGTPTREENAQPGPHICCTSGQKEYNSAARPHAPERETHTAALQFSASTQPAVQTLASASHAAARGGNAARGGVGPFGHEAAWGVSTWG
jgi:hypothetical protein